MGCDNKQPGESFAWMNWWTVQGGGSRSASGGGYGTGEVVKNTHAPRMRRLTSGSPLFVPTSTATSAGSAPSAPSAPSARYKPINLTLVDNFPVEPNQMFKICGKYFNNNTQNGNIKPTSVLALGTTLYAAVQCITYNDRSDTSFPGRQRGFNAWLITSTDGGVIWNSTCCCRHCLNL